MTAAGNRLATLLLQQHAIFLRRESSISRGSTPGNHQRSRRSGEILFITLILQYLLRVAAFVSWWRREFVLAAVERNHASPSILKRVASIVWCYKMQPTQDWKFMAHLKCTLIYIRTVKHVKCMAFSPHTFMAIKCSSKLYLPSRGPDLTKIKTVPKRERGVHFARYFTTLIQARLVGDNRRQQGKVGLEYEISETKSKKHFVSDDVRKVKKASKEAGSVRWSRPAFMRIVSVNRWTRWSLPTTKRAIGRKDG